MESGAAERWPLRGDCGTCGVRSTAPDRWGCLLRRAGGCWPRGARRPSFPFPLGRHPPRVALRGLSEGLGAARLRCGEQVGRRQPPAFGAGGGGWRVSGCPWAWIFTRLPEVLPVCSSLSFHLPSPLLPPAPWWRPPWVRRAGDQRLLVLKSRPKPTWCCGEAGRGRLL